MDDNLIGWVIIGLSVGLSTLVLVGAALRWMWRWDVESYDGHRVRFDRGAVSTPAIRAELNAASEAFRQAVGSSPHRLIAGRWRELAKWWVEVVPPGHVRTKTVKFGRLRDGTLVGGSVRLERMIWPLPGRRVVVVVNERTGAFVLHEACRHIAAAVIYEEPDAAHVRTNLEELEVDAKERYGAMLGG